MILPTIRPVPTPNIVLLVMLLVALNYPTFFATFQLSTQKRKTLENAVFSRVLAEKEGFEPSRQLSHPTPLAEEYHHSQNSCKYRGFGVSGKPVVISTLLVNHFKSGGSCLLYCAVEIPSSAPNRVQMTAVVLATSSA